MPTSASTENEKVPGTSFLPHVAKGALINFVGIISRLLFLYAYTFVLARMLPVDELGEYFLMFTIINLLGLAAMVGLDYGVVRYVSLYAGEGKYSLARRYLRYGLIFGVPVGSMFMVLLFLTAPTLSGYLFNGSPDAITGLRIFALAIPFMVAARMYNATTQGMHRMQYQVYSRDMGEQIFKLSLSLALLALGAGLMGVIWANVIAVGLAVVLSFYFARLVLPQDADDEPGTGAVHDSEHPGSAILRYSYPLALASILVALWLQVDTLLLGHFGTSTDVGYYGVAIKLSIFGSKIITAFGTVFTPIVADLWNRHQTEELQTLYRVITRWIVILSLPVFMMLTLFADGMMSIFGAGFTAGSVALVILVIGQMCNAATGAAGLMVLMSGRSRLELMNVVITLAMDVALCVILIPRFGLVGAAVSNMISLIIVNVMRALEVWYVMHMQAYDRSYIKPLVAGVAGALAAAIAGRLVIGADSLARVIILAAIMLAIYLVVMVTLGLEQNDKKLLSMVRDRLRAA